MRRWCARIVVHFKLLLLPLFKHNFIKLACIPSATRLLILFMIASSGWSIKFDRGRLDTLLVCRQMVRALGQYINLFDDGQVVAVMTLFKFLGFHLESRSFDLFWLLEADNFVRWLRRLRCDYLLSFGGDLGRFRPRWVYDLQLILLERALDPLSHLWKLMIGLGLWNHRITDRLRSSLLRSDGLLLFTPLFCLFMGV